MQECRGSPGLFKIEIKGRVGKDYGLAKKKEIKVPPGHETLS